MKREKYNLYVYYPSANRYELFSSVALTKTEADNIIKINQCVRILTKYPVGKTP